MADLFNLYRLAAHLRLPREWLKREALAGRLPCLRVGKKLLFSRIEKCILALRGQNVMLDRHLADMYRVKPIALRQQVKRNMDRFPADFMFQLTDEEADSLVSQNVIPSRRSLGGSLPYAFTEQGVAMLSSVLRSPLAVRVNIEIMRAFVRLRQMLASHADLGRKVEALERKYDSQFKVVFDAIKQLMSPPAAKTGRIGFRSGPK